MDAMAQLREVPSTSRLDDADADDAVCDSFRDAADLIGKRWNAMIVHALRGGGRRFTEVSAGIFTISDHVLSKRLKELERAGIVARTVTPSTPVCITYSLTERGAELAVVMSKLGDWAEKWAATR
jgi:DNA-binding HxlR family transcriptional regulator